MRHSAHEIFESANAKADAILGSIQAMKAVIS